MNKARIVLPIFIIIILAIILMFSQNADGRQ